MTPPRNLVGRWVENAEEDFDTAGHLLREGPRFREAIAFHSQQAAEKYLKALLVADKVDFPKTHDIHYILDLIAAVRPELAASLRDADLLTPFGVDIRYPGDQLEVLPGQERDFVELARMVRDAVMPILAPYLGAGESAS